MRRSNAPLLALPLALFAVNLSPAQTSPQSLADVVIQQWTGGSAAGFSAVYPFPQGRDLLSGLIREKMERVKGLATAVRTAEDSAVLLLSGVPLTGNSGDDTSLGSRFSGPYEARLENGQWQLKRVIPLQDLGQLLSHDIRVSVQPGSGVDVLDRMTVRTAGVNGFAARLNHRAELRRVEAAGRPLAHRFGGGLLWLDLPAGQTEVTLDYHLPVETVPGNSSCLQEAFGHIRNQYWWHPFFGFDNPSDQAAFHIELRIPKAYRATTSLPQIERVQGDTRIVEGRTVQPTPALSLAYDREWQGASEQAGKIRLDLFLTPAFRPEPAAVAQEFRQVHADLAARFGDPAGGYLAIVQLRGDPGNYWHFNSNQAVFAAGSPGYVSRMDNRPNANLGHEIGHAWTRGMGPAANFLNEGWATYVESLVLQREFGAAGESRFWQSHAQQYFQRYDGKISILEDVDNTNLNYDKGAWIFRMLEQAVGSEAFAKAMTQYSRRSLAGAGDWQALADCFQEQNVPGFDARQFLLPWLKERSAPRITSRIEGSTVTLHQDAPLFPMRVELEAATPQGVERRQVWMASADVTATFSDAVSTVRVDPGQLLLLKR